MIHFDYDEVMKRHNVLVPFTLAGESSDMTVASISKDNKMTMHRELKMDFIRQILMRWDEHSHQLEMKEKREAGEFDELIDGHKNKRLTYLEERLQIPGRKERTDAWKDISINEIEWLSRTWHIFNAAGIRTIGELVEYREVDLYRLKNCGRKTMINIQEGLHRLGLTLKQ